MTDREDHKKKIIDIIKSANNEQEDTQPSSISVNGNGNLTAGRDLNINQLFGGELLYNPAMMHKKRKLRSVLKLGKVLIIQSRK